MEAESPGDPPDPSRPVQERDSNVTDRARKRPAYNSPEDQNAAKKTNAESDSLPNPNLYVHPSVAILDRSYSSEDKGPYIVHISRIEPDPAAGLSLRPIKVGSVLVHNNVGSITRDGVKSVGRNRVAVEFKTAIDANQFLTHDCLSANKLTATVPAYNITRMGLIRGVPTEWSMSEFVEAMELPMDCGKVLKARRLNRKVINDGTASWVPTQSVVCNFSGQLLPKHVYVYHTSLPVETYLLPTIQCHNCCRFGHIKTQCRSKPRCYKCSQSHSGENCQVPVESISCLLCSGDHMATDKKCPEYSRQHTIKLLMSEHNISYFDASSQVAPVKKSYADIASAMFAPSSQTSFRQAPSQSTPGIRSYRKTVLSTPRLRKTIPMGFDKRVHQSIVETPNSSLPNGCAIQDQSKSFEPSANQEIINLILALVKVLSQSKQNLPNNVASKISEVINIVLNNNGPESNNTMEL